MTGRSNDGTIAPPQNGSNPRPSVHASRSSSQEAGERERPTRGELRNVSLDLLEPRRRTTADTRRHRGRREGARHLNAPGASFRGGRSDPVRPCRSSDPVRS